VCLLRGAKVRTACANLEMIKLYLKTQIACLFLSFFILWIFNINNVMEIIFLFIVIIEQHLNCFALKHVIPVADIA
jgi:hypothetical protein